MKRVVILAVIALLFTPFPTEAKLIKKKKSRPTELELPIWRKDGFTQQRVKIYAMRLSDESFREVSFWHRYATDRKIRPHHVPPKVIAKAKECSVIWRGGNVVGFNPNLLIDCAGDQFVPAELHQSYFTQIPQLERNRTGKLVCSPGKSKIERGSYVPYAPEYHNTNLLERGVNYLTSLIQRARAELQHVPSRVLPWKSVADITRPHFPALILSNEHMDEASFMAALDKENVGALAQKFLVEVGLNEEAAKRFSVSSAKACCLAQFICSTYARVLEQYPEARLTKHFADGMRNHFNAIKAMHLLFDSDIKEWSLETRKICFRSQTEVEDCLAASYSAGAWRLNLVVRAWNQHWQEASFLHNNRLALPPAASQFRPQTLLYLAKLRKLRELFRS